MNEFALQLGAVICRASMATSTQAGCYNFAVLGRIGWMAVAGLTLAAARSRAWMITRSCTSPTLMHWVRALGRQGAADRG